MNTQPAIFSLCGYVIVRLLSGESAVNRLSDIPGYPVRLLLAMIAVSRKVSVHRF